MISIAAQAMGVPSLPRHYVQQKIQWQQIAAVPPTALRRWFVPALSSIIMVLRFVFRHTYCSVTLLTCIVVNDVEGTYCCLHISPRLFQISNQKSLAHLIQRSGNATDARVAANTDVYMKFPSLSIMSLKMTTRPVQ